MDEKIESDEVVPMAEKRPTRFLNGQWVEVDPPGPSKTYRKDKAARRKHRKLVNKQRRHASR